MLDKLAFNKLSKEKKREMAPREKISSSTFKISRPRLEV